MIGLFARHPVAPNLLMALMFLAGAVALGELNRQFFPDVDRARIQVSVRWSGVGAEDVASLITIPFHGEMRTLDGLDDITSTTRDGWAGITLAFREGTDMDEAVDEVKDRFDSMRGFPASADEPVIARSRSYESIATVILTGPEHRDELRRLARIVERSLLASGIDRVEVTGNPKEEVAIQVASLTLRELGLTLDAIAKRVARHSRDMPAGTVGRGDFATQLRALEQRRREIDFEQIPILSDERGRRLELGDIATVARRSRPDQVEVLHTGRPAIVFELKRSTTGDTLEAGQALKDWLAETRATLPPGVELHVFDEQWSLVRDRISLLVKNGVGGLALVLTILFLLLDARVAFWVALGIPISFMAALGALHAMGGSINMVSLFALIMTVGIIVDDAIVVGEDALTHYERGASPVEAAERGARRMLVPVLCSSLTTIAAFVPLLLVGGFIGHLMFQIPLVVICVLVASIIECFLILPGHLRAHFPPRDRPRRARPAVARAGAYLRERAFRPLVRGAVAAPAVVVALGLAMLILAAGLVQGGHLRFHFFPSPEVSYVFARVQFVAGTPRDRMRSQVLRIEQALSEAQREVGEDFVELSYVKVGTNAVVAAKLVESDRRRTRNAQVIQAWERHVRAEPGVESLVISEANVGPPGADSDTKLIGPDAATLKAAAAEIRASLTALPGTRSVTDNMPYGQRQLIFSLTPQGEALGLTVEEVGSQLRTAYDGSLAQIFQDGDGEVEVRVMLPDSERDHLGRLGSFGIVIPSGETVALDSVVDLRIRRGFDVLRHANGRLAINVTANIDPSTTSAREVNEVLHGRILPDVGRRHEVEYSLEGRSRSESRTLGELQLGLVAALLLIFLVLAWVFRSYGLPLVVMAAIPFGLIGVLAGHFAMGIDASVVSILGFFALTGIVVNNSIILVTFYLDLRESMPGRHAIEEAACRRVRAVLLTTVTTIAGLMPLMFETSLQAQFLVPIAVSITFGLASATFIVLFLVPALLAYHARIAARRTAPRAREEPHPLSGPGSSAGRGS